MWGVNSYVLHITVMAQFVYSLCLTNHVVEFKWNQKKRIIYTQYKVSLYIIETVYRYNIHTCTFDPVYK